MEIKGYSTLWQAIIRPPRFQYDIKDMGPQEFYLETMKVVRTDLELKNQFGHTLQCSHFEPHESSRYWEELPCVIYLHGNSSSRLEAMDAMQYLLPSNISLFCFDFAGCGLSGGEYISLGWFERDDLNMIVEYLRKERRVSTIGLWGRSMGAVTSLLHGDRDPSIAGMVLDSPFADMKQLVMELAKTHTKIPGFLVSGAMKLVKSTIKSKANFNIMDLSPISHVKECFIPALFATGISDDFIQPHHSEELHKAYAGDKNLVKFEGDHNTPRPHFFLDSVVIFFHNTLQVASLLREDNRRKINNKHLEPKPKIGPNNGSGKPKFSSVMGAQPLQLHGMDGLLSFNGEEGEEEFEDLGVIEGDEENHDEGSRTIMSLSNKLGGMNMQPSLKNNGENFVVINHNNIPDDDEDEIMRKIMEESIKTAEEEEKKRKEQDEKIKEPKEEEVKGNEVQKEKDKISLSEQQYLLECMQNCSDHQQQPPPLNGDSVVGSSIDDMLNM